MILEAQKEKEIRQMWLFNQMGITRKVRLFIERKYEKQE